MNVNLNPASLSPGTYRAKNVTVDSNAGSDVTPISLVVPSNPALQLGSAGSRLTMLAGGAPDKSTGSFLLAARGGTVSWTATASSKPAWLSMTTPTGTAAPSLPATVRFPIDDSIAASLPVGAYYGTIAIAANGVTRLASELSRDPQRANPADTGASGARSARDRVGHDSAQKRIDNNKRAGGLHGARSVSGSGRHRLGVGRGCPSLSYDWLGTSRGLTPGGSDDHCKSSRAQCRGLYRDNSELTRFQAPISVP